MNISRDPKLSIPVVHTFDCESLERVQIVRPLYCRFWLPLHEIRCGTGVPDFGYLT